MPSSAQLQSNNKPRTHLSIAATTGSSTFASAPAFVAIAPQSSSSSFAAADMTRRTALSQWKTANVVMWLRLLTLLLMLRPAVVWRLFPAFPGRCGDGYFGLAITHEEATNCNCDAIVALLAKLMVAVVLGTTAKQTHRQANIYQWVFRVYYRWYRLVCVCWQSSA